MSRQPRERRPRPVLGYRLPSGRGATEQPNAAGDSATPLTATFWALVVVTGVAVGLFGAGMMALLHAVQHLAFGYHSGGFEGGVLHASAVRRLLALAIAGTFAGSAWFWLRRVTQHESSDLDDELWTGTARLSLRRSLGTGTLSEVVVGAGASLGREAAPKLIGGAVGSWLALRVGLTTQQRRLLVACGAGAGMAAVYNVPLGGALLTAELLYGSLTLPVIMPALASAWIATAVSWIYLPTHATYVSVPAYALSPSLLIFAIVAGPWLGIFAVGFIRLIGLVSHYRVGGRAALVAPAAAFTVLGLLAFQYPQLLGNGKDLAESAFTASGTQPFVLLVALTVLKPLVTAMCLGSGATGGLFTPTLSTGALLGVLLGQAWSLAWPGTPVGAFALVSAGALLAAAMQAPLAALTLVIELTHTADSVIVPMIAATLLATVLARYLDGYSIYSSRLPARVERPLRPGSTAPGAERL